MDPPEVLAPPPQMRRRRRSYIFTIFLTILSLLKLEPIARNSVLNDNSNPNIDLPLQEEEEIGSSINNQHLSHKSKKKKPVLYLHIGPPKTATSTIQAKLFEYTDLLANDGILFLGRADRPGKKTWYLDKFPHPAHCPMYKRYAERADGVSPDCFSILNKTLQSYYNSGKDLVLSDEVTGIMYYSKEGEKEAERAQTALKDLSGIIQDWDVRIILGYRPYFDFVTSQFNEQWEIKPGKQRMNKWPQQGGKTVPLVKDSWSPQTGFALGGWPFTTDLANFFSQIFDNITVFDITTSEDFIAKILCNIIENAQQACQKQKKFASSGLPEKKVNVASPLDYDMIATAAASKGLFRLDFSRSIVVEKIKQHHENELELNVRDFPLICPTASHAMALFNASVAQEEKLFPGQAGRLKATFQKRLQTRAFCNVDVEEVLKDQTWVDFFKTGFSRDATRMDNT
eukprot:scaffold8441_cov88-Skeletonema_dohrnii-CCMP3373.AAC.1